MKDEKKKTPPPLPANNRIKERRVFPEITLDKAVRLISKKCGDIAVERFGVKKRDAEVDALIILPMADKELKTMIYWGEKHPINKDEQVYQGIGHYFMEGDRRIIIVSHFLYIYAAERSPVSASIIKGEYDSIMSRVEYEREVYRKNEKACNLRPDGTVFDPFVELAGLSEPVLYGHTHPNLGCFFSQPDRTSGFATQDIPAAIFVADPIRKDMKAGIGIDIRDAQILVFSYPDKGVKGGSKRIGILKKRFMK